MLNEASKQKLLNRIKKTLKNSKTSKDISHSLHDKDGIYQCIIKYYANGRWKSFWASTSIRAERGNLRKATKIANEITDIFQEEFEKRRKEEPKQEISFIDFQKMVKLNTTNFDTSITTKADWDFYKYMKYWLENIIKPTVAKNTFRGYKRNVESYLKEYFSIPEHKKTVKEITADDLDDFYNFLRTEKNLKNSSIDHYQDNISSAFQSLLRKKLVQYNPTNLVNPIKVETTEVPTYNKAEIFKLFDVLKDDPIELPTKFAAYYGLRRSEILGLKINSIDLEKNYFIIKHVALEDDDKGAEEKLYFQDKTKSKKGYRTLPIFP